VEGLSEASEVHFVPSSLLLDFILHPIMRGNRHSVFFVSHYFLFIFYLLFFLGIFLASKGKVSNENHLLREEELCQQEMERDPWEGDP
jgi:hypothetical protein